MDGAWWPRCGDLVPEPPCLAAAFTSHWGRSTRVAVNAALGPALPRKTASPGAWWGWAGTVRTQNAHALPLARKESRWDPLVISPGTPPVTAHRLLARASDPDNTRTATALLAEAEHAPEADQDGGEGRRAPGGPATRPG